jgi:hypothetical protein
MTSRRARIDIAQAVAVLRGQPRDEVLRGVSNRKSAIGNRKLNALNSLSRHSLGGDGSTINCLFEAPEDLITDLYQALERITD